MHADSRPPHTSDRTRRSLKTQQQASFAEVDVDLGELGVPTDDSDGARPKSGTEEKSIQEPSGHRSTRAPGSLERR